MSTADQLTPTSPKEDVLAVTGASISFTQYYFRLHLGEAIYADQQSTFQPWLAIVLSPEFAAELKWLFTDAVFALAARPGNEKLTNYNPPLHVRIDPNNDPFVIPAGVTGGAAVSQATAALEGLAFSDKMIRWNFASKAQPETEAQEVQQTFVIDTAKLMADERGVRFEFGYAGGKGALHRTGVLLSKEICAPILQLISEGIFAFQKQAGPLRKLSLPPAIPEVELRLWRFSEVNPSNKVRHRSASPSS